MKGVCTMKYIYPVIFTPSKEGGYEIVFPDFPQIHTDGDTLEEAFEMAEDALNLTLWDMEESHDTIPTPTPITAITAIEHAITAIIKADTLEYRKQNDTKSIKKTLSIPRWLDTLAKERNVNFSHILQNALMTELNLHDQR